MKVAGKRSLAISNIERESTINKLRSESLFVLHILHVAPEFNEERHCFCIKKERSPDSATLMHNDIIWLSGEDTFFYYSLDRRVAALSSLLYDSDTSVGKTLVYQKCNSNIK